MAARLFVPLLFTLTACASGKTRSRSTASFAASRRIVTDDGGVTQVASSLRDIVASLEEEQNECKTISEKRSKQCTVTAKTLNDLVKRLSRDRAEAETDLSTVSAEASGLKADIESTKRKIDTLGSDIDGLVSKLKELRSLSQSEAQETVVSLQQSETAIAQANLHSQRKTWLRGFLQGGHSRVASSREKGKQEAGAHAKQSGILQADEKRFREAALASNKKIGDDENVLLEGVRLKRSELKKEEETLRSLQLGLADKLKQAAETNRTFLSSSRSIERDSNVSVALATKCSVFAGIFTQEHKLRFKLQGLLRMSAKLLDAVDTEASLQKDLQDLPVTSPTAGAPTAQSRALAQVNASAKHRHVRTQLLQVGDASTVASAGPFDTVSETIQGLISSLTEQANDDVGQHQFCTENIAKNRQSRIKTSADIDMKMSEIRWAEAAVARLDDECEFLGTEKTRLTEAAAAAAEELKAETRRRTSEGKAHVTAKEVLERSQTILQDICNLNNAVLAPKEAPCPQAFEHLQEAVTFLQAMDTTMASNLANITTLLSDEEQKAKTAEAARGQDLLTVKADRSEREQELTVANDMLETLRNDLALVEKAKRELDTTCGPKAGAHEIRTQQRADEIDALKNALGVLNGESVPV